jgi:chromosomal replication initiation ATPase DnaA
VPGAFIAAAPTAGPAPPPRQLALPFPHRPELAAADLVEAPANAEALAWLARTADWPSGRLLLWGEPGCGKTHLLHLWAARRGAPCWPGAALRGWSPSDLPHAGVAIDDADMVPDDRALLHVLNAAMEAGVPVLLAAHTAPARWAVGLPDLASRLRATTAVEIGPADDALLRALLARLLADRQLDVPPSLQAWLLLRLPRTPGALREAAARLDRAALRAGRAISRSLAAEVLAEMAEAEAG